MPTIVLSMKSEKRTRDLFSVEELKERFLYGIKIQKDGKELPDSTYTYFVDFAKEQVEKMILVKLNLQIFTETKNFHASDWQTWNQIRLSYPVVCGLQVDGFFGTVKQVTYPKEWISIKTSSEDLYSRLIHIVPNTGTGYNQTAAVYGGLYPQTGMIGGGNHTPNFWTIKYITGFKKVPRDIETAIGMLAALNILAVGNETLASAVGALGTSSKSISIDGLSQSVSMYMNGQAGIFGARIKQYTETLTGEKGLLQRLQDYYGAILWTTG
jgi:hypothetical protein